MMSRWAYRVGQVRSAHRAALTDADRGRAISDLGPALAPLFFRMAERDQIHAVRVLRRLGEADPILRRAALLHDIGKAETPLGTVGRSLVVMARATAILWLLSHVPGLGPRVRRYLEHPSIGAQLLREAGADGRLVEIVAEHQSRHPVHAETAMLQAVDERE